MKDFSKHLLIFAAAFLLGLLAAAAWFFPPQLCRVKPRPAVSGAANTLAHTPVPAPAEEEDIFFNPLDEIWIDSDIDQIWSGGERMLFKGYSITRKCLSNISADDPCSLIVSKNKKVLAKFESAYESRLAYGFFNFLGGDDKQLVVHTVTGGAHCCHNYAVFDLEPTFRVVYDSAKLGSDDAVGGAMIPVDINGDGVFEFEQDVMAFDYFHASHADSAYPPAVFAYDRKKGRYDFANKKFADYVMEDLRKNLDWIREQEKRRTNYSKESNEDYIIRKTFLNLIYAGREKEAWEYFEKKFDRENKEEFRKDVKEVFQKDVTYKSIYGR